MREKILAMESGRELDALVGDKVMGLDLVEGRLPHIPKHYHPDYDRTIFQDVPLYSSDISAAWEIVKKMQDCLHLQEHGSQGEWQASFCGSGCEDKGHGETAALAICKAALLAVIGE